MSQAILQSVWVKVKTVMMHPSQFFESIAAMASENRNEAFRYYAIVSLVSLVGQIIVGLATGENSFQLMSQLFGGRSPSGPSSGIFAGGAIAGAIVLYFLGLLFTFVSAAILHVSTKIVTGKGNYNASYDALAYGTTPSLLFGWIPFVGVIAWLYSIYVTMVGLSRLHKIGMGRALLAILLPVVIVLIIAIILTVGLLVASR